MTDPARIEPSVKLEAGPAAMDGTIKVQVRDKSRLFRKRAPQVHREIFQPLPHWFWLVAIALALVGMFSANPALTPVSILLMPVLASLLWFRGEPPVLLFACAMQWLQAALAIFYTNFHGVSLTKAFGGPHLTQATWLSLIGVLVLAVGMRLALVRRKRGVVIQAEQEARLMQPVAVFLWYLIAAVLFYLVAKVAFRIPSLTQPLLAATTLKWVLVFLLANSVLTQRRHYALLGITVCLEFFTGVLGYFSGFKSVFFILLVVLPTGRFLFKGWRLVQFSFVAMLVLVLSIVWMVIRGDYREFLNQGTGQQVELAPVSARIAKLNQLVGSLNRRALEDGLEQVILRLSYVNYFALSIKNVPSQIPHEDGALWLGAIKHVLMPRFLFPNKPRIKDSERTEYYSGVTIAGEEQGTSISIGYMGESYIDFGPVWMFAPVVLLGMFYGSIYRFFVHRQPHRILGFAMATSILVFGAYNLETSNIKLVGGNLMSLIVIGLFAKFAGGIFWKLITVRGQVAPTQKSGPRMRNTKPEAHTGSSAN